MHGRPEVKQILISQKLLKWASIGKNPSAYPNCSPSRARRNYARLFARHEVRTEFSVTTAGRERSTGTLANAHAQSMLP
jgi:hypothetical protein